MTIYEFKLEQLEIGVPDVNANHTDFVIKFTKSFQRVDSVLKKKPSNKHNV
jgi:hypothetical protein